MKTNRTTSGISWIEMHGLLAQLEKNEKFRDCLLIATGCYLGLRASDLLNLKWRDVYNKDELELVEKKTNKLRHLTINPFLKDIIHRSFDNLSIKPGNPLERYLFENRKGEKLSIQYVNRNLHKIFDEYRVKVKNGSTHTLRKTFGKRVWDMDGKSERALIYLSQIFNHSSTHITRKYIGIVQEDISNIYLSL